MIFVHCNSMHLMGIVCTPFANYVTPPLSTATSSSLAMKLTLCLLTPNLLRDGLPPGEYTLALRMDPMNPGSLPNAEPYDLKVEKAGTLTIDLKPASGNRPGAGLGLPIQ